MYFPIGSFRSFSLPIEELYEIIFIRTTRDRLKLVLLTPTVISVWLTKPTTLVGLIRRSANSIAIHGQNLYAEWRNDTQKLAVATNKGYLIYYKVAIDKPKGSFFGTTNDEDPCEYLVRVNTEAQFTFPMVRIKLVQDSALNVGSNIQGLTNLGPDLLVADDTGFLYRISWDGSIHQHLAISLGALTYTTSLNSDRVFKIPKSDRYAKHIEFSPLLNGIGLVFNDGTSGLIICETSKFEPQQCQCILIQPSNDEKLWKTHCCVALNAIYQLLAFGSSSGQGVVYYIDELTASLQLAFKIQLSVENFPDLVENLGALCSMKWSPDYRVLCTLWENGAFAVWTVFGILLHCSYSSEQSLNPLQSYGLCRVIEWGPDGYTLWIAAEKHNVPSTDDDVEMLVHNSSQLIILNFLKSSVINNPHSGSIEHLLLQSEDKVYLYLSGNQQSTNGNTNGLSISVGYDVGWQVIQLPQLYIHNNWPIKFACIDNTGQYLAVAGQHGFVHFSLFTRKWKLFGNAGQERDIRVVGGLLWWQEFIVCGCTSTSENRDERPTRHEIRLYSRLTNLDNQFSNVTRLQSPIICLNIYDDTLIAFCYDLHIMLYGLEKKDGKPVPTASVIKLYEISVESYVPHAVFVPFIGLTPLRTDSGLPKSNASSSNDNPPQSILINVCGRLLLLQQERGGSSLVLQKPSKKNALQSVTFLPPVMIAAWVESIWTISHQNSTNPYLSNALWLCCGLHGMKVWLPLHKKADEPIFQSHRIMLTFGLTVYPLAVVVEEAVILGAMSELENFNSTTFCSITKTTQVFLNHVFQELIRKNLDFDALQIAQTCKSIPHFSHVLELLLHKVLEEEATSTLPIPDPLLPRVTDFIKLFPQFLRIVSHCARKTEVALWPCLFSTSIIGDPKKLFQECLNNNNLETAASYLIIIQNLEKSEISQQFAQVLLEHALANAKWELATDILRFIRSIDPQDLNNDEYIPTLNTRYPPQTKSNRVSNTLSQKSALSPHRDTLKFTYVTNMRQRTSSVANIATNTSTITTIPEAPPLPTTLSTIKPKLSWPSPSTVLNTNPSTNSTMNNINESQNNSNNEIRKRKTSSSENKSPRKDNDSQLSQQQSFDSTDSSLTQSPTTSSSIHFIQKTLNQHALQTIAKARLRHLGYMAANIADFDLLNWLKTHKHEPALIVSNYSETLKALHMEFNWPFPVILSTSVYFNPLYRDKDSTTSSTDNNGHHSDSGLGPNDRNGDHDGKFSTQVSRATSKEEMNVDLTPKKHRDFLDTLSLTSEASSMPMDNEFDDLIGNRDIESLSQELANRGPHICEKQIRYLYEIFLMADCYDWSFLFSLILKSQTMITQVMNAIRTQDLSTHMFALQRGLLELETWADSECPGYKTLLLFVRNQAQILINQRRTFFPPSTSPTKKQVQSDEDDELFSLPQSTTDDKRPVSSRKKPLTRNRTSSATDTNQTVSTFESLSINTQLPNNKSSRDTSPSVRTRRFSGDLILPPSSTTEVTEPSLFSPGSVRARTITSAQENKPVPASLSRQNSIPTQSANPAPPPPPAPPQPSPPKRIDIRLNSGQTYNTSDFIHPTPVNHLINPHIEMSPNQQQQQQQQNQLSNETTRNKLLQSVYVPNTNPTNSNSLSESLTNGTNSHSHSEESSSNCVLA